MDEFQRIFNQRMDNANLQLGSIVTELTYKMAHEKATLWEERLRLHVKPKPAWMPDSLWQKIVGMVLVQSSYRA